ncbi:MAG: glycosyltransferase family 1 protein [Acidobacteriaceae bacterium]
MPSNSPALQPSASSSISHPPTDLICFSHLRWHFVTQRPQHLLTRAARIYRVFFWEEPIWHGAGEIDSTASPVSGSQLEVVEVAPTLWVLRPHLTEGLDAESTQRALLDTFLANAGILHFVRWYYTPMALGFSSHLRAAATVYDCMDELSHFLNAPPELTGRERELFRLADVVFTGGISLYEAKRQQHPSVFAFPSSIDVPHFAKARTPLPEPADQAPIPHPRAGFVGVIDERLDIALLREIARLRPQVHFILIGPVVKIDPASLPQSQNLHYLGGKTYDELPAYLAGWDVALMPFAINAATEFISPTKTPEYLAAGKPVVSTPIRDVVRGYGDEGLVSIAADAESFATAIDRALMPPTKSWQESVASKLAAASWDSTWGAMQHEILHAIERKNAQPTSLEEETKQHSLSGV